jgi:hypothetical protein
MKTKRLLLSMASALLLALPGPAWAYIEKMYELKDMVDECTVIYTAKIASVDRVKRRMTVKLIEPIKGKTNIQKVNYNLAEPQFPWQSAFALSDLSEGHQAILFFRQDGEGDMKSLLFANGYFMQFVGGYDTKNLDNIWINFTHIEIRMNRTFCGTTVQFMSLLHAHLKDKKPLPAARPQVPEWTKERMQAKKKETKIDFEDPAAVQKALEELAASKPPAVLLGSGTGLKAEYFDNADFTNLKVTRVDPVVKFEWNGGEAAPGVAAESFSVRWTGFVQPKYSEVWTFYINSDDGVRLWVNGKQLIDNWTDHAPTVDAGTVELKAGQKYEIKMEYYQGGGPACAMLMWSSESQEQEIVPATQLYPPSEASKAMAAPPAGAAALAQ